MGIELTPPARGIAGVRADSGNATKLLAELQKTFEDFKLERDKELADIKAGMADVVQTEKVDRINAELTKLTKDIDTVNAAMAAIRVGGVGHDQDPDKAEHAQAFDRFFRRGVDAGLRDLEVKAKLTTQSDPDGGYLVPEETEAGIDRVLGTVSTIRSLARTISISTSTYKKLVNMGGATSGWVGEEQDRPGTATPTLREIAINTGEIYASFPTTFAALRAAAVRPAIPRTFKLGKLVPTTLAPARPAARPFADLSWERDRRHGSSQLRFPQQFQHVDALSKLWG